MTKILILLALVTACSDADVALVKDDLSKKLGKNLTVETVELGDLVHATPAQKQDLALLGLKDSSERPLTVTFRVTEDCVAVAEAIQNDIIFNEKNVSCRPIGKDGKPNLRYVKQYNTGNFGRRIAVHDDGKVIKKGETFVAKGMLVHFTLAKDEKKSGTLFTGLE